MPEQRRLASGRFAKVTNLPSKTRRFKRAEGGVILVRTNAAAVARDLGARRLSVQPNLLASAKERAARIEEKMRAAAMIEYSKTGTGRFARGIRAQVSASTRGNVDETIIKISSLNYREARFLTNIGGGGYFTRFPVGPYTIWARGAEGLAQETPIGVNPKTRSNLIRVGRLAGVGRLKVPREGSFFTAARKPGRGGGESRFLGGLLDATADEVNRGTAGFFYPLKVEHPGFRRDVISDIAREEGARFVIEAKGTVSRSLGGEGVGEDTNVMVVSDEIPLTRIDMLSGRSGASFRRIT
jgi:hypothetical protein